MAGENCGRGNYVGDARRPFLEEERAENKKISRGEKKEKAWLFFLPSSLSFSSHIDSIASESKK